MFDLLIFTDPCVQHIPNEILLCWRCAKTNFLAIHPWLRKKQNEWMKLEKMISNREGQTDLSLFLIYSSPHFLKRDGTTSSDKFVLIASFLFLPLFSFFFYSKHATRPPPPCLPALVIRKPMEIKSSDFEQLPVCRNNNKKKILNDQKKIVTSTWSLITWIINWSVW